MLHIRAGVPAYTLAGLFNSKLGGFRGGRQQRGNRLLDASALLRRVTVKNLLDHTVAIHQIRGWHRLGAEPVFWAGVPEF